MPTKSYFRKEGAIKPPLIGRYLLEIIARNLRIFVSRLPFWPFGCGAYSTPSGGEDANTVARLGVELVFTSEVNFP